MLELLIVLSLFCSMIIIGSWWKITKHSFKNDLNQTVIEVINYLNQVQAASVYSEADAFIEVKKESNLGFVFQAHFNQPICKDLCLKKKFLVKHFDTIQLNNSVNEDVKLFFDGFLEKSQEGVLLLNCKKKTYYIEMNRFPLRKDNIR